MPLMPYDDTTMWDDDDDDKSAISTSTSMTFATPTTKPSPDDDHGRVFFKMRMMTSVPFRTVPRL